MFYPHLIMTDQAPVKTLKSKSLKAFAEFVSENFSVPDYAVGPAESGPAGDPSLRLSCTVRFNQGGHPVLPCMLYALRVREGLNHGDAHQLDLAPCEEYAQLMDVQTSKVTGTYAEHAEYAEMHGAILTDMMESQLKTVRFGDSDYVIWITS